MTWSSFATVVLVLLALALLAVLLAQFYIVPNPVLTMPPGETL